MTDIPHVYVLSTIFEDWMLEELSNLGIDIEWWEPLFGCIGGRVDSSERFDVNSKISELDWIHTHEKERFSTSEEVKMQDTKNASIQPAFDFQGQLRTDLRDIAEASKSVSNNELQNATGEGVRIAIIDSGIDTRNDHVKNVSNRYNFTNESILDSTGHGTIVASIAHRTAPGAELVDMKVSGKQGIREGAVIRALGECIRNDIDVINMSLGFRKHYRKDLCPVCHAAEIISKFNILIVAAAGNDASENNLMPLARCPARNDKVLSVGSVDSLGWPKSYTNSADIYQRDDWLIGE
ncbi:MAG: S8 family serine peptidase [Halorhabdus sp.]